MSRRERKNAQEEEDYDDVRGNKKGLKWLGENKRAKVSGERGETTWAFTGSHSLLSLLLEEAEGRG
jgi:hypothetical protein